MSIYKLTTEMGSYQIKEAAAMLCAKWLKQGLSCTGKLDLEAMDSREFMQDAIRDAVIVEIGKHMQAAGVEQDSQNYIFKELFDDDNDTPKSN